MGPEVPLPLPVVPVCPSQVSKPSVIWMRTYGRHALTGSLAMTVLYQLVAVRAAPASGVLLMARISGLIGYFTFQLMPLTLVSGTTAAPLCTSTLVALTKLVMVQKPLLAALLAPLTCIALPTSLMAMAARPDRRMLPAAAPAMMFAVVPDLVIAALTP